MKKISVLAAALCLASVGFAQFSLTYENNGLRVGDVHTTRPTTYIEPGAAGPAQTWDFSQVTLANTADHTETIAIGSFTNIAVTNSDGVVFNFEQTAYGNEHYGYVLNNHKVIYESPILKTKYPFGYQDVNSGKMIGHIQNGDKKTNVEGDFSSEVDGYGTLLLPNGIKLNNVIRVKTIEHFPEFSTPGYEVNNIKYLWYASSFRYPVFIVFQNTYNLNGQISKHNAAHINTAALLPVDETTAPKGSTKEELVSTPETTYTIYPNPVIDEALITYNLLASCKVNIAIYEANSMMCVKKLVSGELQTEGTHQYSFTPQYPGVYYVKFAFDNKIYTETIVKR